MLWRRGKDKFSQFRAVSLPGEVGSVSLPAHFVTEMEDDQTLLAYPPGEDTVALRFSSISVFKKGSDENPAEKYVKEKAAEEGVSCTEIADKSVLSHEEEESEQDGVPLVVRFWEVGTKSTVVIVSATIIRAKRNHRMVKKTLDAMPSILGSLEVTTAHRVIEADGREVMATVRTVDPTPQSTRPFGPAEEQWLETSLNSAGALGLKYGSGGELTPEELDQVFSRWLSEVGEKEPGELVANALGAALGSYLVEHHGFAWVVLTDEYGTEYAVRHPVGQTTGFPRASVEKRIERREPEFFQDVYLMLLDQLRRSREEL